MRVQFDEVCRGTLDYLAETCLERFSRAVRSGYVTRAQKQARDEYRLGTADMNTSSLTKKNDGLMNCIG
ncbi:MAG: hypothetical protein HFG43_07985 [Lachnospiraceae bacterium]|nr:hypothetical protein [Lachnospiraceae bacterium]